MRAAMEGADGIGTVQEQNKQTHKCEQCAQGWRISGYEANNLSTPLPPLLPTLPNTYLSEAHIQAVQGHVPTPPLFPTLPHTYLGEAHVQAAQRCRLTEHADSGVEMVWTPRRRESSASASTAADDMGEESGKGVPAAAAAAASAPQTTAAVTSETAAAGSSVGEEAGEGAEQRGGGAPGGVVAECTRLEFDSHGA